MGKDTFKNNKNICVDKINEGKMTFRVINHYPKNNISNSKDIEKRLSRF